MRNIPRHRTERRVIKHIRPHASLPRHTGAAHLLHKRVSSTRTQPLPKRQRTPPNATPAHQQASPPTPPAAARKGATTADWSSHHKRNSAGVQQHSTVASRGSTGDGGELKGCRGIRTQRVASERGQDTTGERGRKRRWWFIGY